VPHFREDRAIASKPPPTQPPKKGKKPVMPLRKRAGPRKPLVAAPLPATPGTPRKKAAVAGPVRAPVRRTREKPVEASRLDQLQQVIIGSLTDDKAEAVVTLDLAGRATFTDRMVIATGLADRQIAAMATHLEEKLRAAGLKRVQIEGASGADWVLIDAGDIIVHLFKPDARAMYGLERMWGADLDEDQSTAG
jgi:ribosome silencing factor RsfS/YbeB/iojap